jgi:hypothetical protein
LNKPQIFTDETQIFSTADDADFRRFIFNLRPSAESAAETLLTFICVSSVKIGG